MLLQELEKKKLIGPPSWLPDNTMYLTIMGSEAYGVSSDASDKDIYGFCIPPQDLVFPHLSGEILGFGRQVQKFEQWQQHHVKDEQKDLQYDFGVYSIVKYFQLCMENNPNMLDSMFTPINCVIHCTKVGNMVRDNRKLFLHKGVFHKMKGYAYSQLHKMHSKDPIGKRKELRELHGFDTKFAYHVVRLLSECEQILMEGDLDLQEKGRREHMKAIRRGEVSEKDIREWFAVKERELEKLYHESKLQYAPDEAKIKALLIQCLEEHYGSLAKCIVNPDAAIEALREIQAILSKNRNLL